MTNLESALRKSFFLRMKIPGSKIDSFISKIMSLPEEQKIKSVSLIIEAEKKSQDFIDQQIKNSQEFLDKIPAFTKKTKEKYQTKKQDMHASKTSLKELKSKIKK